VSVLRAPQGHGAVLADPPLHDAASLLDHNRRVLASPLHVLGRPLADLRRLARNETGNLALQYAPGVPGANDGVLIVAGHQPEFFHPGVWVKNFALAGLARTHRGTALNLVVDNDTAKSTRLRVPVGDHFVTLPFDHWQGEVPYEERHVLDDALFAALPERLGPVIRDWPFTPLLAQVWKETGVSPLLGERISAARRTLERRWGCCNLEVPLSRVCGSESFAWFACHVLADLARFREIYNDAVHGYRAAHGLRSNNHPVPDLAAQGSWREAPFWAWRTGSTRRGRLFAQQRGSLLCLRAGDEDWPTLPLAPADALVGAFRQLEGRGYKVRSRALTTTLFARLLLADLFIHGIGGAKYDELTNVIFDGFYGLAPPRFLTLSATLLLPFARVPAADDGCRALARMARDVHHNPQRHLPAHAPRGAFALAEEKKAWIVRPGPTHADRVERFNRLKQVTEDLRGYTADAERDALQKLTQCRKNTEINQVLFRRDYAFCLYPEAELRPFLQSFLKPAAVS